MAGEPLWIPHGYPVPVGLLRIKLESPTQSMAPSMTGKEVCYIELYVGQPIKVNDFVCFTRWDGKAVLHRVTAMNKRAIYTSGDANSQSDGWTENKDVRYILRLVERN